MWDDLEEMKSKTAIYGKATDDIVIGLLSYKSGLIISELILGPCSIPGEMSRLDSWCLAT